MNVAKQYSVSTKILLIAASFSVPIAVLVWLMVSSMTSNISFARLELQGNQYQRALEQVLDRLQGYRFATITCASPASCAESSAAATTVNESLESLAAAQRAHGEGLQFTPEGLAKRKRQHLSAETLTTEWKAYAAAATNEKYAHLTEDVRGMITHAGDTSNLILDPDLDSYYLMDVTLIALPQMQDRLERITSSVYAQLAAGTPVTLPQQVQLAVGASMLKESDYDRILASSQTSLNEDQNFYGVSPTLAPNLGKSMAAWKGASDRLLSMMAEIQRDSSGVTPAAFLATATAARRASFDYWATAVDELDRLFDARLADYQQARTKALALAALATLGAVLLSVYFMRSITRPLDGLIRSLGPGATLLASSVESIAAATKDGAASPEDASIICEELNAHAHKMRLAVAELAAHVQGRSASVAPATNTSEAPSALKRAA